MTLLTLVRRQFRDVRWSLAFSVLAFFGLSLSWNWGISRNHYPPPEPVESRSATETPSTQTAQEGADSGTATTSSSEAGEAPREAGGTRPGRRRGTRFYISMGVPFDRMIDADDPPTLLMQVALCNSPLILMTVLGWAIARGSAAVAGEIERGTLDLTLTRPVRRSTYLASQVLVMVLVFLLHAAAMIAGHLVGPWIYPIKNPPGVTGYFPSMLMVLGLGLSIFGYALAFSARDLSRGRAGILALGLTLAGLAGIVTSNQLEGYEWMARLSVFDYYAPVALTNHWDADRSHELAVLYGVFAVGAAVSFVLFLRRDLPTGGG